MVPFQRRYWTRVILIAVLLLSFVASTAFASQLDDKRAELRKVKAKIEANKKLQHAAGKKQTDVMREIDLNLKKVGKLQSEISRLQIELKHSTAQRKSAEARLFATQKQLKATQSDLSVAEMKLAYKRETFDMRVNSIYKNGPVSILEILLNSRDIGDLLMRTSFITAIAEYDGKMVSDMKRSRTDILHKIDEVTAQKKVMSREHLRFVDEENHLKVVKRKLVARQGLFESEVKRQKAIFARVQRDKTKLASEEDVLFSTSRIVADQIRTLQRGGRITISRGYSRASSDRGFVWPVSAPITSPFGWRFHPVLGYSRMHTGIDLGCGSGTPVHATKGGTVIMAGWMGGYGNAVVIDHGGGISSLYGHNSRLDVSVGQHVDQGQVISHSGSTGMSTGPHLHFEIRVNGNPENPVNFLP